MPPSASQVSGLSSQNSETLQRFWAMSRELNEWTGLVLPWQPLGRPARADEPAVHHCVSIAVTAQLIFGFFLCSMAGGSVRQSAR